MESVQQIIRKYDKQEKGLVAMLQDIQKEKGYLPEEDLSEIAAEVGIPVSRLYSLATFYKAFSLVPRGRHTINVCLGTACHVRGGARLLDKLERDLDVKRGETTEDGLFTLETVNCLGACALSPIMVVDGEYHGQMTIKKVGKILPQYGYKPLEEVTS